MNNFTLLGNSTNYSYYCNKCTVHNIYVNTLNRSASDNISVLDTIF